MVIHAFDKKVCRTMSEAMIAALIPVAKEYGLLVERAGGSYTETEFTAKVRFAVTTTLDGTTKEQADFNLVCGMWHCKPEDYKRKLKINGQEWELIGFDPKRPKYAIKVRHAVDGRMMNFCESVLKKNGILAPWDKDPVDAAI